MRDRSASLVLPRYNNAAGTMTTTSPSTSPNGSQSQVALERGDSILLDIEGGDDMQDGAGSKRSQGTWWQPDVIASPFRTAVVSNVGTAVSSGWSRARGAIFGSSFTSYLRRFPSFEKPFDLKDIPNGPEGI